MSDDRSTLNIERRGNAFALVKTLDGETMELPLLESEVLSLARVFPSYAQALNARRAPPGSDILAWVAIPLRQYQINSDLHNQVVLLRFIDANEADFGFSMDPSGARDLGQALIQWSDQIGKAPKPTQQ